MRYSGFVRFLLAFYVISIWYTGYTLTAQGQSITPADTLAALRSLRIPASIARLPARPPMLDTLEHYDARRLARVAVVRVSKPALSDPLSDELTATTEQVILTDENTHFRLNDEVILYVQDLRLALRRSRRPSNDLRLYIGDIVLPMEPRQVDTISQRNLALVRFKLLRNADTEATWQIFYHLPDKLDHNAHFNIGFKEGQLGLAYPAALNLRLVQPYSFWIGLLLLLPVLAAIFFILARDSNFIRSDLSNLIPLDRESKKPWGLNRYYRQVPFSLAKSQVAFWTLLTIGAYLMITLVTTDLPSIPTGLLGLLGISVTNNVVSQLINQPRPDAGATAVKQAVDNIGRSRGWVYDVLNDASGVNLARLQFILFNFIAGGYLVYFVSLNWSLPNFDSGILALISISSAGFLANKSAESAAKDRTASSLSSAGSNGCNGYVGSTAGNSPDTTRTSSIDFDTRQTEVDSAQDWNNKLTRFRNSPRIYDSDPGLAIFGNQPAATDTRRLQVTIAATLKGGLDLLAVVTCTAPLPDKLEVVFLLHPTYDQRVVTGGIDKESGQATLSFFSAGCFTLIAMLDEGKTILAFDLATIAGAPSSFLAN